MRNRVFVVEDELKIAFKIASFLELYGYQVHVVQDFSRVLEEFQEYRAELVILDVNLPGVDGFTLCKQIRQISRVPILFLSARKGEMEQIFGIESGGDDYMTKPFQLDLLLAKVRSLFRRAYGELSASQNTQERFLESENLVLHLQQMELKYQGEKVSLSKNECKLLQVLISQPNTVVTRDECLEILWDDQRFVDDNTLTVNVTRVRKKLAQWGMDHLIETKRGVGYKWVTSENE